MLHRFKIPLLKSPGKVRADTWICPHLRGEKKSPKPPLKKGGEYPHLRKGGEYPHLRKGGESANTGVGKS